MIGKPKFKIGDKVKFEIEYKNYIGNIYIVDEYGTFEDNSDVSYDIMVDDWGPKREQCLFKHITEKLVSLYTEDNEDND